MQKRSHKLLASTLLARQQGFSAKRYEWAFLFGSFQPDCNPLTYLNGSLRAIPFRGHHFSNSQFYIRRRIRALQARERWTIWQYYTLGKLTHYLADAFTYPHNEDYPESLLDHRRYENDLRVYLAEYLSRRRAHRAGRPGDLVEALEELHRQYMETTAGLPRDARYVLRAAELLMAGCAPA